MEGPVDTLHLFDSKWHKENNWCNPEWPHLPNLVKNLRQGGAVATAIAPIWTCKVWHLALTGKASGELIVAPRHKSFQPRRRALRGTKDNPHWAVITTFRVPSRPEIEIVYNMYRMRRFTPITVCAGCCLWALPTMPYMELTSLDR
jgi:hypothetical protein